MKLDTQSRSSSLIKIWYDKRHSEAAVHQHSAEWLFWKILSVTRMWWIHFLKLKPVRVSRKWWCPFSILNFKSCKKVMQPFFSIKIFKIHKKGMRFFLALITVKVIRKWRSPFFSIKNFKSRQAVMESFFSFKSFKSREKVTESFFSNHASLSFHMMHKTPGTIFSLSVSTEFLWSLPLTKHFFYYTFNFDEERCRAHFSKYCKSYFSTAPINSFTYIMSEAAVSSFTS